MRAMVFGPSASGKSTFALALGEVTGVSVIHLDRIIEDIGRDNKQVIEARIVEAANRDAWIIDGNAFDKDPTHRIEQADILFSFYFSPVRALANHVSRWHRMHTGAEQRVGAQRTDLDLDLGFFIPYLFSRFPSDQRQALTYATTLQKEIVSFNRRSHAANYLAALHLQGLNPFH